MNTTKSVCAWCGEYSDACTCKSSETATDDAFRKRLWIEVYLHSKKEGASNDSSSYVAGNSIRYFDDFFNPKT